MQIFDSEWPCKNCEERSGNIGENYFCKKHGLDYPFVAECGEEGPEVLIYEIRDNKIVPIICSPEQYKEKITLILREERVKCHKCGSEENYYREHDIGERKYIAHFCENCGTEELARF